MNNPRSLHFGRSEAIFSLKTFVAAILALAIAFSFGFAKPYWALATVYTVSQPLSAAVASKALYRVGGTLAGALAALLLVPNLINAPVLLCVALSGWVGGCLFVSLLDRTPRSYFFMLAGYTAAIVGFASVYAPEAVFDTAVARVQEITLGIVCAALVNRLIFPRHVEPVLAGRIEVWLEDAAQWAEEALSIQVQEKKSHRHARKMAADTVGMVALIAYLPYGTASFKRIREQMTILEQHMAALIPLLSAIGDRIGAMQQAGAGISPGLGLLLEEISAWIKAGKTGGEEQAELLREKIRRLETTLDDKSGWHDLLELNLYTRLSDLVNVWEDCLILRKAIAGGQDRIPAHLGDAAKYAGDPVLHLDVRLAWISGLAAIAGTLTCCAFWIGCGWNEGSVAAQLTAVFCCIFSALDNPLPALKTFTLGLAGAVAVAAVYQFLIFPAIDGFPMLVLVLAPFLFVCGLYIGSPVWGFPAFALCVNGCLFLNLETVPRLDFLSFWNNNLAAVSASFFAMIALTLFRSIGAEAGVIKLLQAAWTDAGQLASRRDSLEQSAFVRRMVDRLGLLVPRLPALPAGSHLHDTDILRELRVGLNIADIQRGRSGFTLMEMEIAENLLPGLSAHFQSKLADAAAGPETHLLETIDTATTRLIRQPSRSSSGRTLLHALIGIRRCLFPKATGLALTSGANL